MPNPSCFCTFALCLECPYPSFCRMVIYVYNFYYMSTIMSKIFDIPFKWHSCQKSQAEVAVCILSNEVNLNKNHRRLTKFLKQFYWQKYHQIMLVGYVGIICLLLVPKSSGGSCLACRRKIIIIICGQREDCSGLKYDYLQKMETKPLPFVVAASPRQIHGPPELWVIENTPFIQPAGSAMGTQTPN